MRSIPLLILGLAGPVCSTPARAQTTFYVEEGGSDGAAGTAAAPWATLQHAADRLSPGDTVVVRQGSYAGFHLTTSGTAGARITFRGEAGAVVDRDNPSTPDGINLEATSYVTVEGLTVTGATRAGLRVVLADGVVLRDNVLDQNGRWGILTGFCDDLLIEGNQASRSGIEHGIYVSNSGDRPSIRNNRVFSNNANGIHMNGDVSLGGDGIISGALVEGNVIWENGAGGGSGINCDGVQGSVIRNNLIYETHASGISLYQIDGGGPSTDNLIVNNTVVVASEGRWALNIQEGIAQKRSLNNILLNLHVSRGSLDISADSLPGFVSDNNLVLDRITSDDGNSILSLAQWRAASGQDASSIAVTQADITTAGAIFVAPGSGDYHLAPNSPAVDHGRSQQAPVTDLEGIARPQGSAVDIGAYESCAPGACGAPVDAGVSADAGSGDDAGASEDSGSSLDAGPASDSGPPPDSGPGLDAGGVSDVGVTGDAGTRQDAAASADAGTSVEADAGKSSGELEGEGCGCDAVGRKNQGSALILAVLALSVARKRRL